MSETTTVTPKTDDEIAAQLAAYEAKLRRENDPAVLAEKARRREWDSLRTKIIVDTGSPPLCFRGGRALVERFEAAERAGDIDAARELVGIAHNRAHPNDFRPIPENDGMRARRLAAEETAWRQQAEAEKRRAEQARQILLRKYPDSSFVLRGIEKKGTLWLAPDGAVTYTGEALAAELLQALALHERDVRIAVGQRWYDQVILPAPEPSAPASAVAA